MRCIFHQRPAVPRPRLYSPGPCCHRSLRGPLPSPARPVCTLQLPEASTGLQVPPRFPRSWFPFRSDQLHSHVHTSRQKLLECLGALQVLKGAHVPLQRTALLFTSLISAGHAWVRSLQVRRPPSPTPPRPPITPYLWQPVSSAAQCRGRGWSLRVCIPLSPNRGPLIPVPHPGVSVCQAGSSGVQATKPAGGLIRCEKASRLPLCAAP